MARTCQLQSMFSRSSRCTFESLLAVEVASRSMHVECITKDPIVRRNKHIFHTLYYQIPNSHSKYLERPGNGTETIPERPPQDTTPERPPKRLRTTWNDPEPTRPWNDLGPVPGQPCTKRPRSGPETTPQTDASRHPKRPGNAPETTPERSRPDRHPKRPGSGPETILVRPWTSPKHAPADAVLYYCGGSPTKAVALVAPWPHGLFAAWHQVNWASMLAFSLFIWVIIM